MSDSIVRNKGKRWSAALRDSDKNIIAELGEFDSKQEARDAIAEARREGHYTPDPYFAMTHSEIGARLGISRQCVKQIERRALDKLRSEFARRRSSFGDLC